VSVDLHACPDERPQRADARRNRERILEAAEEVFADKGVSVPVDEVARVAGLGVGTLYRHFPTKEALIEAVLLTRMTELVATAQSLAESPDPGAALFDFLALMGRVMVAKRDLSDALASAGVDLKAAGGGIADELGRALGVLLVRAQAGGVVRADVTEPELLGLTVAACKAGEGLGDRSADPVRLLAVVCDGLRTRV